MIPPEVWRDLEGLPYRKDGRGPEEYDCLGVMAEALRRWLGPIEGLDVSEPPTDGAWERVSAREALRTPGAVTLTDDESGQLHVWTVLGNGRVLTAMPDRGVCTLPVRVLSRARQVGCYRLKAVPA